MNKKLIEVALPLEAINKESAREKSIRHGHPSTLHLWWSRKPLATCRAVLFASLVDDPSSHPDEFPTEEAQGVERERLFRIIEDLVKWENSNNEKVLEAARREILKSTGGNPPPVLDPFCGGGSIPLEAQRLGLEAHASDLNPVAVLITKALIEIPPKFAGKPPVHPHQPGELVEKKWKGARGLAEDVRFYGKWMRGEAEKKIGHLYPKARLPKERGGGEATVIAWLWIRTVTCPNPACGAEMPLTNKWWLSTKKGKKAWVEPLVDKNAKTVRFRVKTGEGAAQDGTVNRQGAQCIVCESPVPFTHIRKEGKAGRMGARLIAIVAEGDRSRVYLDPDDEHVEIAKSAKPKWAPETDLPEKALGFRVQQYGMTKHRDLFTPRQLTALTTFSDLVAEARERVRVDALAAGLGDDPTPLDSGGLASTAYADAVATYLAFLMAKLSDICNSLCAWEPIAECPRHLFGRQAIPMVWDFSEGNPLGRSSGSWTVLVENQQRSFASPLFDFLRPQKGNVRQADARSIGWAPTPIAVVTDPPYYDNIGYADLSDFFYVWHRRILGPVYPAAFSTLLCPKEEEIIASPYRSSSIPAEADDFFEEGLRGAFTEIRNHQDGDCPAIVFYAFKQAEADTPDTLASTGWEKMLDGLARAGLSVLGTWPMRTEMGSRMVGQGTNALASSIVLVCRPRPDDAPKTTRREFIKALKAELPDAIRNLQKGNIAPVDLAQASIGPGMAVFSRYSGVLEADGTPMRVRMALALINQMLDEILAEQEGDFDPDTRWAVAWFDQFGMNEGPFGEAETLSRAKNTSVQGMVEAGFLKSKAGKARLLKREELDADWDPTADERITVWEIAQHLVLALGRSERDAADLLRRVGPRGGDARELAYRLYSICEKKKWAEEALSYNTLVIAWPAIAELAAKSEGRPKSQDDLFA